MTRPRRFSNPRQVWFQRLAPLILLAALAAWQYFFPSLPGPPPVPDAGSTIRVTRAVDGDTLLLERESGADHAMSGRRRVLARSHAAVRALVDDEQEEKNQERVKARGDASTDPVGRGASHCRPRLPAGRRD